jgi:uncharacterized protein
MPQDACTLPARDDHDDATIIRRLLALNRIAVVGLSDHPSRPSYYVSSYMMGQGKEIIPVNPRHATVFGLKCYPSLEEVPGPIELINIFRRPELCPEVVRSAVKLGARGIWIQSGIISDESRQLARQAGIDYIEDRCIMVEHMHGV